MTKEELNILSKIKVRSVEEQRDYLLEQNILLKKSCDETQELLNKQIEATYKVVEELNKAKELIRNLLRVINDMQIIGIIYDFDTLKQAEAFLKED